MDPDPHATPARDQSRGQSQPVTRWWGAILGAAILVWGSYIALGAYRADEVGNPRKAIVILACTLGFVILWAIVWWKAPRRRHPK